MTDGEIFAWLKHNNDYRHSTKGDYDVAWNIYVKEDIKQLWVVFEETQQLTDWKCNFMFPASKFGKLWYHGGFLKQYMICREDMFTLLNDLLTKYIDYNIRCIGWSLGSALAAIAAQDIRYHTNRLIRLTGYGCPKVCFGKKTAERVKSCLTYDSAQYCNVNDLVCYMPPIGYTLSVKKNLGKFNLLKFLKPSSQHNIYDELLKE